MILPKFKRTYTGLYISKESVSAASIEKDKKGFTVTHLCEAPMPEETIRLSYRTKNIINKEIFRETVMGVVSSIDKKISHIGLSLPNEIIKLSIQKYAELPGTNFEINKMIAWRLEKSIHISAKEASISHSLIGTNKNGEKSLLAIVGIQDVIRQFEMNLLELGIHPKCILPSGLNQLNFFINRLPTIGTIAFLGLFEYFFTFFVFEDSKLTFYHGIKKGFSNLNFFQDVDMIMLHFLSANPDEKIEQLFIGTQVGFHRELEDVFNSISNIDIHIMHEDKIIDTCSKAGKLDSKHGLSYYVPAIGAALSIA